MKYKSSVPKVLLYSCFLFSGSSILLLCSLIAYFFYFQERRSVQGLTQQNIASVGLAQNQGKFWKKRTAWIAYLVIYSLTAPEFCRVRLSCWPTCFLHYWAISLLSKLNYTSILILALEPRNKGYIPFKFTFSHIF